MSRARPLRRPLVVAALACAFAMVGAPAAQAYWITTLTGFHNPSSVAVSPRGDVVYVTNNDYGQTSVGTIAVARDGAYLALTASPTAIPTASDAPRAVAFSPDGARAYVTTGSGQLRTIDVASGALTGSPIAVDPSPGLADPWGVAISPDGRYAYTANRGIPSTYGPRIGVIDLAAGSRVAAPAATVATADLAVSPDGARVYMAPESSGGFGYAAWLDTADRISQTLVTAPTATDEIRDSRGVAVSPDGARAYFANAQSDRILVADTALTQVVQRIDLASGTRPLGLAVNRAGTRLYSANYFGDSISVVSLPDGAVVDDIQLPGTGNPLAIALSPDDTVAWVVSGSSNTVFAVQLMPFAPTDLAAAAADVGAVVSFTAPAANGTPITGYQYSLNGGAWSDTTPATTASPLVVNGLKPSTAYAIRVRAVDARGPGAASAAVAVTTRPPAAVTPSTSGISVTPPRAYVGPNGSVTVRSRVRTPGPGRIRQTATSPSGKAKAVTRCSAQMTVKAAGEHLVTCRLNAKARAALRTARLVLTVTTTFTATGATTGTSTTDRVVVPRRR